ncbi:putative 3-phosphoinositide-dependent protein kinase 1 [Venustampulla echinocandica]|uniref:non-specific serine/threonine protein kinase n=1 Tax=Venustampulla echinocandica TaxID=2656787 RepID=A0A370TNX3_9HELO|nr:putative 3-phosphoinositide-dependent protein kinase 1 [Venustampulla echinocandica]RDL37219.1 putative 3-phosphoinositide-dependent protein kinase 1 [Venustampulla echinocandica]
MNHDLSLSQSLGGLRIANPDDTSTSTSTASAHDFSTDARAGYSTVPYTRAGDTQLQLQPQEQPQPPSSPVHISRESRASTEPQSQSRRHSIFNILRRGEPAADLPPSSRTPPQNSDHKNQQRSDSNSSGSLKAQADAGARAAAVKAYRQSMPLNHQAQQQAQFPPYQSNAMQNGRGPYPPPGSSRPISGVYSAQPPPNAIPSREHGSYRLRNESSRSSILGMPTRSDSRGGTAMQAMQAGVPSREPSHRDRSYGQNHQLPSGNGPLPPRRSSRGTASGHTDAMGSGRSSGGSATYDSEGILVPVNNEARKDNGATLGAHEEYDASGAVVAKQAKKGVRDFVFGRTLGEGSYSTVLLATDRQTLKEYAVKILDKKHIIKEKKIKYVNIEKDTLNRLIEHPGIVRLYYTFQDASSLYYVLDIASGGELLGVLKKIGSFDEECTRFYGAQILDAIEHMHNRGVIHRDLKPENVLLDDQMHIKITDFGTAKLLPDPRTARDPSSYDPAGGEEESTRARSFVGTAEYVSPELLTDKNACKASDLWAFGCIIYQLLAGRPPFKAVNEYQTFQKIVGLEYDFPPGFPPAARDLVERLLVLDPQRRLTLEHIKNHEFFDGIIWGRGLWRQKAPRLKPYIPPPQEPTLIKLNGYSSAPQPIATTRGQQPPTSSNGNPRPQPRVITELPPPTQLDIEWSPVLTRDNERILKLGNLNVLSTPMPHSPSSKHGDHGEGHEKKKFSRFFGGGNTSKKRPRLVMITSSARILMLPPGGDEKRTKAEISLLASECSWRTQVDAKGQEVWVVDTRSTQYTFEDTKSSVITGDPSKSSAQEWIESLERAKDMALSHSMVGSYSSDTGFDMSSSTTSPNSTLHGNMNYPEGFSVTDRAGRHHLTKSQASLGVDEQIEKPTNKKHRFSKRQSKTGLSTPF